MPTVTLSITNELKSRMEKHPELNWSEVARRALLDKAAKLELFKSIVSKSRLREEDALELGRKVNESLSKRYERLVKGME